MIYCIPYLTRPAHSPKFDKFSAINSAKLNAEARGLSKMKKIASACAGLLGGKFKCED